jgi:type IV pilus assembly protein PilC
LKKSTESFNHRRLKQYFSKRERLFHWTGLSPLGEQKFGQIRAKNRKTAHKKLRNQQLIVKTITHKYHWSKPIKQRDITLIMHQLTTLIASGITVTQGLHILSSCQTNLKLLTLLAKIQLDMTSGNSFSEALQRHPKWFDHVVCGLVALGERSGTLINMMTQISKHQTTNEQLKQQLQTILTYPLSILLIASIVSIYLLITVVPQFQTLFHNFQAELPLSTRIIVQLSQWMKSYGYLITVFGLTIVFLLHTIYRRVLIVKKRCDRYLLQIPVIGKLCQQLYIARSFHALSITTQAGLPLVDALQWIAQAAKNHRFHEAFLQIRAALTHGDSICSAIHNTGLFPELVIQMLHLGEKTGTVPNILIDLTHYYTRNTEQTVQRLQRFIEPAIMIILGLMIGGLVIAMYLPILKLGALV